MFYVGLLRKAFLVYCDFFVREGLKSRVAMDFRPWELE